MEKEDMLNNHYYCKSLEEFVNKLKRGDGQRGITKNNDYYQISKFFYINKITLKKIKYLEKHLGVDLSQYKRKLNYNISYLFFINN